jgi:hypothetical protein
MSTPSRVLILRHGEKPGSIDDTNLSTRGFERAAALAICIPNDFTRPDFHFATRASHASNRPVLTITPLSQALGLPIDDKHKDDDFQKVADDLLGDDKYAGKVVCVCWHHGKIPDLANALGAEEVPSPWNEAVFDRVWQLEYGAGGAVTFSDLPQKLLFGDTAT